MKKYLVLAATLVGIGWNASARTPDSLNYKLDLDIKKYNLRICDKSPHYAYKIVNDTIVQGRMFEYKDSSYTINIYYYYGIGVTRIDATVNGDSILVRTNHRLTINNKKTRFGMHYEFYDATGRTEAIYNGKRK